MKTPCTTTLVFLLVFATLQTLGPGIAAHQTNTGAAPANALSKEDEQAIRKTVAGIEGAWNAHDMDAYGKLLRADVEWVNVVGMHWKGRDEVMTAHVAFHKTSFKNHRIKNGRRTNPSALHRVRDRGGDDHERRVHNPRRKRHQQATGPADVRAGQRARRLEDRALPERMGGRRGGEARPGEQKQEVASVRQFGRTVSATVGLPVSAARDWQRKLIRISARCSACRIRIRVGGMRPRPGKADQTTGNRRQNSNVF